MRFKLRIIRGFTKKQVARLENKAWARGYNAGVDAVGAEFHRRLALLEKDNVDTMTIQALKTWYIGGK